MFLCHPSVNKFNFNDINFFLLNFCRYDNIFCNLFFILLSIINVHFQSFWFHF